MPPTIGYLPLLHSRGDYVEHLDGLPFSENSAGLTNTPTVEAYMLETGRSGQVDPELGNLFPSNVSLHRLDDSLYRAQDTTHGGEVVGLIETSNVRYPVLYTTLPTSESNEWVGGVVDRNAWLDRLWLASPILFEFAKHVQLTVPAHHHVRLGYDHQARYDTPPAEQQILGVKREPLVGLHDPARALVQLQIRIGNRGERHLHLHHDGRISYWNGSFGEHRAVVNLIVRLYQKATTVAEEKLWVGTTRSGEDGFSLSGAPMTAIFGEPLSEHAFNRFVEWGIKREANPFRIGGYVTRRGPTKIHLAGIDHHLWQPFLLEATSKHLIAVFPMGVCGNTVHRLVVNTQRYLDPNVEVWLGDEKYEKVVAESMGATATN